ncbi:SNF2-related protein [Akanthomyces lecanii RCEF 1005]|uniref:SNF2-related protein n=1 Tax=Akanthomyces lecanii RCEF 1005 TaxID=1081108 RepID=A0A162MBN5_CORDF|nr:SNF2-related protein [Akanthomyces lecanii RCEF 1005]
MQEPSADDKAAQELYSLWSNAHARAQKALGKAKKTQLEAAHAVVGFYHQTPKMQSILDNIATSCKEPVPIPLTYACLRDEPVSRKDNFIDVRAVMLVAAVQLLMFSPITWTYKKVFKFEADKYPCRFPSPPFIKEERLRIGGKFSIEDLHRALVLILLCLYRRQGKRDIQKPSTLKLTKETATWIGYVDPSIKVERFNAAEGDFALKQKLIHEVVDVSDGLDMSSALSQLVYQKYVADEAADAQDPKQDHRVKQNADLHSEMATAFVVQHIYNQESGALRDDAIETTGKGKGMFEPLDKKTWETLLKVCDTWFPSIQESLDSHDLIDRQLTSFVKRGDTDLEEYVQAAATHLEAEKFAKDNPADREGILDSIRRCAAFDMITSKVKPRTDLSLEDFCTEFNVERSPDWERFWLYPKEANKKNGIQALMPHQIADIHDIIDRARNGRPIMLTNEMGLGKTKTFLGAIECHARYLESLAEKGKTEQPMKWERASDEDMSKGSYYPHLIVNPPATIIQTTQEAYRHFPSLTCYVYFSNPTDFPIKGVTILTAEEFRQKLREIALQKNSPQSARTIFMSTNPTIFRRNIIKTTKDVIFAKPLMKDGSLHSGPFEELDLENVARDKNGDIRFESRKQAVTRKGPFIQVATAPVPANENDDDDDDDDRESAENAKIRYETDGVKQKHRYYETDLEYYGAKRMLLVDPRQHARDGIYISYSTKDDSQDLASTIFRFVIVDEAHNARRHTSQFCLTLRLLNYRTIVWVTGTPLTSSLKDLLSPLSLIWRQYNVENAARWRSVPMEQILAQNSSEMAPTEPYKLNIWSKTYDPFSGSSEDSDNESNDDADIVMHHELFRKDPTLNGQQTAIGNIRSAQRYHNLNLWQLNPCLFAMAGRSLNWDAEFGRHVASVILEIVSINRTLRCRQDLPGHDKPKFPSTELPPMKIRMVEVDHVHKAREAVKVYCDNILQRSHAAISPDDGETDDSKFGNLRRGVLVSHDNRCILLLARGVEQCIDPNARPELSDAISKLARKIAAQGGGQVGTTAVQGQPLVGTEHVQLLVQTLSYGVLQYFYSNVSLDDGMLGLASQLQALTWSIRGSPILAAVLKLLYQHVIQEKRRVVIYCDTPMIQA